MTQQSALKRQVKSLLNKFVNQMLAGLLVFILASYPLVLMKWHMNGFLPENGLYTIVISLVCLATLLRKKLPVNVKGVIVTECFILLGVAGAYTYGLAGGGMIFIVACGYFCSHMWGRKVALWVTGLYFALLCVIAGLYIAGELSSAVDLNRYDDTYRGWLAAMLPAVLLALVFISSSTALLAGQHRLTEQLFEQKLSVEQLANFDKLTGLPSLRLADQTLKLAVDDARERSSKAALLYLDLDGFKAVNDTYGHDAGDYVLATVAQRLQQATRDCDMCCRIGGDEFLIIVPEVGERAMLSALCQRLLSSVQNPIDYQQQALQVGASIGVALYPDHAQNASDLRKCADEAMYAIKNNGKNNFGFSDAVQPTMVSKKS